MNFFRHFHIIITLAALVSCGSDPTIQSEESKRKLAKLHSGFNDVELEKLMLHGARDTLTIVTFGHVNSLLWHEDVFDSFVKTVNEQDPDYVWVLGDIVYDNTEEEWDCVLNRHEQITGRKFYVAGNHDIAYHIERYNGILEHQWEAEERFLSHVGYRYRTIEDNIANYMILNLNDSLFRIKEYLELMLPKLNPNKPNYLFTHQSTWQNVNKEPDDPSLWVNISFPPDSLLKELVPFDYLINGDWTFEYFRGKKGFGGRDHHVIACGNKNAGDELRITVLKLSGEDCESYPIVVPIPKESKWYD